jgi:hypothetical protein
VVPEPANVTVDSHITNATGLFSSSVFVQDLLPTIHSVLIKKDGYYDYQKNLMVKENQVTKLEHVVLIPKIIAFSPIETTGDNFWIAPNNTTLLLATLNPASVGLEIINLSTQQKQIVTLPLQKPTMPTVQWSADSNNALINSNTAYFLLPVSASSPAITKLAYSSGATNASFNPQDASQIFYLKNKNLYQGTQVIPYFQRHHIVAGLLWIFLQLRHCYGNTRSCHHPANCRKKYCHLSYL